MHKQKQKVNNYILWKLEKEQLEIYLIEVEI